jgi:hypothetical protein
MGYRSDVVAIFYATDVLMIDDSEAKAKEFNERNRAKLKLFVEENFPKYWRGNDTSNFDDCLTMLETHSKSAGGIRIDRLIFEFKVSSVKWYDEYPEVFAFNQFWEKFSDLVDTEEEGNDPCDWAAEFVRLGENTEDIEERSSGDAEWLLQVSRVIENNY